MNLMCKKYDTYCKAVKSDEYIQVHDTKCSETKCEKCKKSYILKGEATCK